ncbi:hypothetical protein [Halobellus clavatus]|jgi:hypothetical protein|uniref:Uncharacterized protein n=1 Tax=Halobellus clavatus TaxID=660517 RepID=A0A1H3IBC3_9EURY|nr:hypothetical protein [Halobellus clavatus]SDY24559.1 hypothetical protein SAMN04487946_10986 [Halobellus clavatus]
MSYRVECDNCDLDEELQKHDAYRRAKEHEGQYTSHTVAVLQSRE